MAEDRTSERGLGSKKIPKERKDEIRSMGGHAQPVEAKREGGRKGGSRSRRTA